MYCINCGIKLADTEKNCPLCHTSVYHPDIKRPQAKPLYPVNRFPEAERHPLGAPIIATVLFLLAILTVGTCDIKLHYTVTWSGYVIGALLLTYEILILPSWFRNPNPAIFVPCGFLCVGLYLLYIDLASGGRWFLSFAFPVTAIFGCIITTVSVLIDYLRRGILYILGGALIAIGLSMPLVEYLLNYTFSLTQGLSWSVYTLSPLLFLGGTLIFFAICRPARQAVERRIFF